MDTRIKKIVYPVLLCLVSIMSVSAQVQRAPTTQVRKADQAPRPAAGEVQIDPAALTAIMNKVVGNYTGTIKNGNVWGSAAPAVGNLSGPIAMNVSRVGTTNKIKVEIMASPLVFGKKTKKPVMHPKLVFEDNLFGTEMNKCWGELEIDRIKYTYQIFFGVHEHGCRITFKSRSGDLEGLFMSIFPVSGN